jgi:hypothetical protein
MLELSSLCVRSTFDRPIIVPYDSSSRRSVARQSGDCQYSPIHTSTSQGGFVWMAGSGGGGTNYRTNMAGVSRRVATGKKGISPPISFTALCLGQHFGHAGAGSADRFFPGAARRTSSGTSSQNFCHSLRSASGSAARPSELRTPVKAGSCSSRCAGPYTSGRTLCPCVSRSFCRPVRSALSQVRAWLRNCVRSCS